MLIGTDVLCIIICLSYRVRDLQQFATFLFLSSHVLLHSVKVWLLFLLKVAVINDVSKMFY